MVIINTLVPSARPIKVKRSCMTTFVTSTYLHDIYVLDTKVLDIDVLDRDVLDMDRDVPDMDRLDRNVLDMHLNILPDCPKLTGAAALALQL